MSLTGNGAIEVDGRNIGGGGGSSLTIGGTLTNSSTNGSGVSVGNTSITSADTLTVNGTGGLSNTGKINIEGSATVQATLNVADDAAGFGTAGTETGTVFLENDALLEFKSGQITTVDGTLQLDGANSRVARAATPDSNSALTGLTSVAGRFLSAERRNGRPDRQFERHRQRRDGGRRAQHRRRRGQQPDDRRDADQQQHQRQRRLRRQHRHHFGRHLDGERDRRALQRQRQRDQH